jgi:predicted Zn finger-like uncharacterized protein
MAILMILGGLAPLARADHDSLQLVVLAEYRDYSIGSSCRVTVHAFERADPTDVDNVPEVRVGAYAPRPILMEKVATGKYQGAFQIEQMDALNNFVLIQAWATKGRTGPDSTVYDASADATSIYVATSSGGAVEVLLYATAVSGSVIGPGTNVTFRAETVLLGANIEPSFFNFSASYFSPDGGRREQAVPATNVSTGVFEGNYTFPQVDYNLDVTITASARYINDTASRSLTLSSSNFFVLYHDLGRTANQSSFELFVADRDGRPVAGAAGDLTYWTDNQLPADRRRKDLGTTDVRGCLAGMVEYGNGTRLVHLQGYFNVSGQSQSFSGTLEIPKAAGAFEPDGASFQAVYTGTDRAYGPKSKVVREYAVFNNSAPIASRDVDCYITAAHISPDRPLSMSADTLVYSGTLGTDNRGRMNVSFDAPVNGSYLFLRFRAVTGAHPKQAEAGHYSTDGLYYSDDTDIVVAAAPFSGQEVTVEASPLKIGEPLDVKAQMHSKTEASLAYASWIPGKFDPYSPAGTGSASWQMWSSVMTILNRSAGGFFGKLTIPSFMPPDIAYSMVVFASARNGTLPYFGVAALKPAQGVNAPVKIPSPYIMVVAVVIIAAAGGAALVVHSRRRRALAAAPARTAALEAPSAPFTVEKMINCPDCGTQFIVRLGPAPSRIRCPRCGKTGTLPALPPRPAQTERVPGAGGRGPGDERPTVPAPGTRYPAPAVQTRTIACPRCRQRFTIEKREGPQQITCPHCGKQGVIGRTVGVTGVGQPSPTAIAPPEAPPARAPQQVPSPYAPPAPAQAPRHPAPGTRYPVPPKLITCPYCRTRFPVQDPRRPISVRCPGCGREGVLRK